MASGYINSIQTLGAVDGPGVRFVAFLQGCPLRCVCCHNPETQSAAGGIEYTAEEIVQKAERYKSYFGKEGGITLSGGDPIMQPEFAKEIFRLSRKKGIHTCLDTSGYRLDDKVEDLLRYTDLVLLDIKYTNDEDYKKYVGCEISAPVKFLDYLQKQKIPVWIRQVIIPGFNDTTDNINCLKKIISGYSCVEKVELLPFRKICEMKYEKMGIEFPLKDTKEPTLEEMQKLQNLL